MNRPDLIRFLALPLLAAAAIPAVAQPPAVTPTQSAPPTGQVVLPPPMAVMPPPVPLPALSQAQDDWANEWLKSGMAEGLMARSKPTAPMHGQQLLNALLDRGRALSTGRVDTADFLEVWALRPPPSIRAPRSPRRLPRIGCRNGPPA